VDRLRPPFSAVARERWRRRFIAGVVLALVLLTAILYLSSLDAMAPLRFAVPAAAYVSVSGAVSWSFFVYCMLARYRSRLGWHLAIGGLFGSGTGVLMLGVALVQWHLAAPDATAAAAGAAAAGAGFSAFMTRSRTQRALAWSTRRPADRRAAQATYDASRYALSVGHIPADQQRVARLNAAQAAIARSVSDDAPDGLVEATDELRQLLREDPPEDWLELVGVAVNLVDAMSRKADKHGDLSGYMTALQLLADAADRAPADAGMMAIVHSLRADYQLTMAGRLRPGQEGDAQAAAAVAEVWAAIYAVTPSLRRILPGLYAKLGLCLAAARAHASDLDTGIELCRTGVRLAGRSPRARAEPELALATLLIDRAETFADELPADAADTVVDATAAILHAALAEAERLGRRARRYGGFDQRSDAADVLAQARTARASILGGQDADQRAARAWREAARAAAHDDPLRRVRVGKDWVAWAEATQNASWCAEAYAYLMSVVPPAVAVRYLAGERDSALADLQSATEDAGYWLAQAGRFGDAAIALELGRAVSLTEVLGRERLDLEPALRRARRPDLLEQYRVAVHAYRAAAPTSEDGLTSAAQRAWAGYEAVVREIAAVVDIEMPGVPPTLAELAAAAGEGPVVFLAAAGAGGYAVIVPAAGPPVYWPLPLLTRAEVAGRVARLRQAATADASAGYPAVIAATAYWLWGAGIGELASDLPAGALVTIVPVGHLSLLPVHAAGGPTASGQAPADWTFLADRVTVRYAHNARTLLRTRARAGGLPGEALSLLAVAAPDADPRRPLPASVPEVEQISRLWKQGAGPATITDGAHAAVERMLTGHSVWHFACHCYVRPRRILDSALLLSGGELSLRAILALPPAPRRLAVLSACQTHWSDSRLPDEAMGLPAGLLQAGFAGVIASHWPVEDLSTAYLMARFHDLWHNQGLPAATALAEAQRWLRTATHADLRAYSGIEHADPPATPENSNDHPPYRHPFYWAPFALTGH